MNHITKLDEIYDTLKRYNNLRKDPDVNAELRKVIDDYNEIIMIFGKRVLELNKERNGISNRDDYSVFDFDMNFYDDAKRDTTKTAFDILTHDLYRTFECSNKDDYKSRIKETVDDFVKEYRDILGL